MAKKTPPLRRHPRFKVDLLARFRLPGTFAWKTGLLMDLSKGGVCLYARNASVELQKGTKVELEILTEPEKGQKRVRKLGAIVSWARGSRYGMQFIAGPRNTGSKPTSASHGKAKSPVKSTAKPKPPKLF